MIKLDDDLLKELGLDILPPEEKKRLLAHIYETLEMRVGMELAQQMTDQQLNEFEQFIATNNEKGALQWLETNFPYYKEVVAAQFGKLKNEIKRAAPQIIEASKQPPIAAPAPPLPPTAQQPYQQWPQQPYYPPQQPYVPPQGMTPPAPYGQPVSLPQQPYGQIPGNAAPQPSTPPPGAGRPDDYDLAA